MPCPELLACSLSSVLHVPQLISCHDRPCPAPRPALCQVYNSPSIPPEVLAEVSGSMGRVYTLFDRSLR